MRWITFGILLYAMYALSAAHLGAIPHVHGDDWPQIEYLEILAVFYALFAAESAAPFCALVCGVCYDVRYDQIIGTSAVPLAIMGYLVVRIRLSMFREHFASQMLVTLLGILVFAILSLPMHWVTDVPYEGLSAWRHFMSMAGNAVYSAIVAPMLFWFFFRFKGLLGFSTHGPRMRGHG